MLKIAVFAPMPKANVSTTTAVKPGDLGRIRVAYFRSWIIAPTCSSKYLPAGLGLNETGAERREGFLRSAGGHESTLPYKPADRIRYSYLSATIGSTRVARRTGMYAAANATTAINTGPASSVSGCPGLTPYNIESINRPSPYAAGTPIATPIASS